MNMPKDLITAAEARALLGVSRLKMTRLLATTLRHFPDPLDNRKKLVSRTEVLALKVPRAEAA